MFRDIFVDYRRVFLKLYSNQSRSDHHTRLCFMLHASRWSISNANLRALASSLCQRAPGEWWCHAPWPGPALAATRAHAPGGERATLRHFLTWEQPRHVVATPIMGVHAKIPSALLLFWITEIFCVLFGSTFTNSEFPNLSPTDV